MIYQGTAYSYNQRSEILLPTRRGTTYHGVQNHKPLIAYVGVYNDFEFFVTDTSRKPVSIENKTFSASVVNRTTNQTMLTKTLTPIDYTLGTVLFRLTEDDTANLTPALYDVTITYTDSESRNFGLYSDQNARLTYVLEVKENPASTIKESTETSSFSGASNQTSMLASTAQTPNSDGTNTVAVYVTGYTGTFSAEATLETSPTDKDWFSVQLDPESANDSWTFTNASGVVPFTWDGMFMWVRFSHTPDPANTGTLDKIIYRA